MRLLVFGLLGCVVTGCTWGQSCTEIGCSDGASLQLRPVDGRWAEGQYTLTLAAEGRSHTCSLRLPDDLPARFSTASPDCGIGSTALFQPEVECTETRSRDTVSQSCTPLDGRFTLDLSLEGTPATMSVELRRDDQVLIDERIELSYEASRPNGPGCEPLCRTARVERSW
jgi:hypothetical protein